MPDHALNIGQADKQDPEKGLKNWEEAGKCSEMNLKSVFSQCSVEQQILSASAAQARNVSID